MTACILVMNLTGVGAFAIWVLYAREHLGLSDPGFGLFITTGAIGGIAGSRVYGFLERRLGKVVLLRAGLIVEALAYAGWALTANPWIAGAVMMLFGVHAVVWGTAADTVRQQVTPSHLLGRVTSAYRLADLGGAALGALDARVERAAPHSARSHLIPARRPCRAPRSPVTARRPVAVCRRDADAPPTNRSLRPRLPPK